MRRLKHLLQFIMHIHIPFSLWLGCQSNTLEVEPLSGALCTEKDEEGSELHVFMVCCHQCVVKCVYKVFTKYTISVLYITAQEEGARG